MSLPAKQEEAEPLILHALDAGINYFDTADIYQNGNNETVLGKAFAGKRDKVIIASKAGNIIRADGNGFDWNPSKEHILKSIEGSLKRLRTDYIDLYQLHGGTINDNIDESIEAFEQLKQQGKIRYYGISSIRPNVINEYANRSSIISVMMQFSLLDRRPEEQCLDLLKQKNISVVTRGTLAQGLLVNKPAKPTLGLSAEEVDRAAKAVGSLSGKLRSATQTAICYVLQHEPVASTVIGVRTMDQLNDVLGAAECPRLNSEELNFLKQSTTALKYAEHRI